MPFIQTIPFVSATRSQNLENAFEVSDRKIMGGKMYISENPAVISYKGKLI